jgi:hypothetical protein
MVTSGGVVSTTVIVKEQLAEFPALSKAVHVTVVSPRGKVDPGRLLHTDKTTLQLSVETVVKSASAPAFEVASTDISPGQVI